MAKTRKRWIYRPAKPPAPRVPTSVKVGVEQKANELIETVLKPQHIKPAPKGYDFNYIVDIYAKWYRHYFYFCAKYCSPGPNALSPFFETKFARMEFIEGNHFNLSFMRHTGAWIEIYPNSSLEECLATVKTDPLFAP